MRNLPHAINHNINFEMKYDRVRKYNSVVL